MSSRYSLAILILVLTLSGCQKNNSSRQSGGGTPPDNIYLTGQGLDSNGYQKLIYWQKTGSFALAEFTPAMQNQHAVTGIAVKGSDVYVCGYLGNPSHNFIGQEAVYWKNGSPVFLGDSTYTSIATGITISGSDIYISGFYAAGPGFAKAVYWKNGIEVVLSDSTLYFPMANAIAVSGTDVYAAGSVSPDPYNSKPVAVVWKNGSMIYQGDTSQGGAATCIAIVNGDVYAAGWAGLFNNNGATNTINYATYWKNGIAFNLHDSGYNSRVNGIAVLGDNVYAAGNSGINPNKALYWKNGTPTFIGQFPSWANSISISGTDVFVGGWAPYLNSGGKEVATYWKNGNPVYLNNGTLITAMYVP
jgi:hypothetical protein